MVTAPVTEDVPKGTFRVIEYAVKSREEKILGDFAFFTTAHECVEQTFRVRGEGWFTYYIFKDNGTLAFVATTTKKKWFLFMKTTFVSETYSYRQ